MKQNYLLLLFSLLLVNAVYSQENATTSVETNQFKINMLFPGFVYEHGFSAKNTLYSEVALGVGYSYSSFYDKGNLYFYPLINEQLRHYYNLEKRANKGKRTANNSGNYLALSGVYNFTPIVNTNSEYFNYIGSSTISVLWGLQRTYKGKFNLEFNVGPGINIDKNETEFVPAGNFTLGWVLGK